MAAKKKPTAVKPSFALALCEVLRLAHAVRAATDRGDEEHGRGAREILKDLWNEAFHGVRSPDRAARAALSDYVDTLDEETLRRLLVVMHVGRDRLALDTARTLSFQDDRQLAAHYLTSKPLDRYLPAGIHHLQSRGIDFDYWDSLYAAEDRCESPLETALQREVIDLASPLWPPRKIRHAIDGKLVADLGPLGMFYQQVNVGSFRLDFAIVHTHAHHGGPIMVAVEVDGHNYHSSKEQLARDKSRDREITASGWRILRFTGSEVYAAAWACAAELIETAYRLAVQPSRKAEAGQCLVRSPWEIDPKEEFAYRRAGDDGNDADSDEEYD